MNEKNNNSNEKTREVSRVQNNNLKMTIVTSLLLKRTGGVVVKIWITLILIQKLEEFRSREKGDLNQNAGKKFISFRLSKVGRRPCFCDDEHEIKSTEIKS